MPQGVSKYCIFNEDFRYVFKCAVGAVVYKLTKAFDSNEVGTEFVPSLHMLKAGIEYFQKTLKATTCFEGALSICHVLTLQSR